MLRRKKQISVVFYVLILFAQSAQRPPLRGGEGPNRSRIYLHFSVFFFCLLLFQNFVIKMCQQTKINQKNTFLLLLIFQKIKKKKKKNPSHQ